MQEMVHVLNRKHKRIGRSISRQVHADPADPAPTNPQLDTPRDRLIMLRVLPVPTRTSGEAQKHPRVLTPGSVLGQASRNFDSLT